MADNAARIAALQPTGVLYYPYVEPTPDADKGLLFALAKRACVVVTDDCPSFFLPRMVAAVANRLPVRLEQVDSNGLLPLRASDRVFTTAFSFRAFLQKELPEHLTEFPVSNPLKRIKLPPIVSLPPEVIQRWPAASRKLLGGDNHELGRMAIDHRVGVLAERGGPAQAQMHLRNFLEHRLPSYGDNANQPDDDVRSGLSPFLHFGHISPHQLFDALVSREEWTPAKLGKPCRGKREVWWGMDPNAEAWLDQFVTWRELGYNMSSLRTDYDHYESLPDWAQATLAKHACDPRPTVYSLDEFADARTHDHVWNAAQRQLIREGRIHNYMRMLWGKKILEWTRSPRKRSTS
jgi:deoxyribodipyrimidine photo-lyase